MCSPDVVDTLTTLGWHVGIVFQMINDLNNITGRDVQSKGSFGHDFAQHKKTMATLALQHVGITFEQLADLPEDLLKEALQPVTTAIDQRIRQASDCIADLPNGLMKRVFRRLLKEAQSDWFWIDVNR